MDMMALTHLVYTEEDPYIRLANETVNERYLALMNALGLPAEDNGNSARYYALVDILALSSNRYGEDFSKWLSESRTEIEFLNELQQKKVLY